jgi:hypothetical protein
MPTEAKKATKRVLKDTKASRCSKKGVGSGSKGIGSGLGSKV